MNTAWKEGLRANLERLFHQKIEMVMEQREEILSAFIAKYGYEPDRIVQIEQRLPDGSSRWFVQRRTDEEMANDALLGAQL